MNVLTKNISLSSPCFLNLRNLRNLWMDARAYQE